MASRLVARIGHRFKVQPALRAIFEAPDLAGLARLIDEAHRHEEDKPAPQPIPRDQPIPLSFSQERQWVSGQIGRSERGL